MSTVPPESEMPTEPNWATDPTVPWSPTSAPSGRSHFARGGGAGSRPAAAEVPDELGETDDLVERTRRQIRRLTQEIATLSQSDLPLHEFYEGFLSRITQALVSQGAAIWMTEADSGLQLAYQVQLPEELLHADPTHVARHSAMLDRHRERGEAGLVPPRAGANEEQGLVNPTSSLLVLAPLRAGDELVGVIEVFQRPGSGPATQRGYVRFLAQMAEHASAFLKSHRFRELRERHEMLERMDRFAAQVHRHLELEPVLFSIVNEGRNVVDVDRVSIALKRRGRWQIQAVSGLDSVERRSADLKAAGRLVQAVCRVNEPLWYSGDDQNLPPQIETPLHEFLDLAHSKSIGIVPLFPPQSEDDDENNGDVSMEPIGCLIFERLTRAALPHDQSRATAVASHVERALSNALELHTVPFSRLLRRVGKWYRQLHLGSLSTAILVLAAVVALIGGMFVIPYPFSIQTPGQLIPSQRQEIFSPLEGTVHIIDVTEGEVQEGARLIQLVNERLVEEISQIETRRRQLEQQITSIKQQLVGNYGSLSQADELKLVGEQATAETEVAALMRNLELKQQELELLRIEAPIAGALVDDRIVERLQNRRVERGQKLMTLVNPSGPWELELYLPEKRLWQLKQAQSELKPSLEVEFQLSAALPGQTFVGRIVEVDRFASVREGEGNCIVVRVAFDRDDIPEEVRVAGARVEAKIKAGQQSVAYVLFNDFWQMIRSQVLFPLG